MILHLRYVFIFFQSFFDPLIGRENVNWFFWLKYYTTRPIEYNNLFGTSSFILASWEHEMFETGYYT